MANKKVSQLTSKPSVLVTDLFPIADPSTGQLYKTTISDLGTAIGSGVSSVNGLVGAVVLDTDDIQELVSPTNKWFTDTRARAALSASSPLAYNSGTGVFSIPAATSSQNGYLTSTDWTTFNSKQAALSGTGFVKISGTTISYDNSTYLTTSSAASTYLALSGGTLTGAVTGTRLVLVQNSADIALSIVQTGAGRGLSVLGTSYFSSDISFGSLSNGILKANTLGGLVLATAGTDYQAPLSGTGFVKSTGGTISYDTSTYALDSAVVKLTGDQNIDGNKEFILPTTFRLGIGLKNPDGIYNYISSINSGWKINTNNKEHQLLFSTSTAYTYTFPSATGTIALTSNLSSYLPLAGGTLTGALNGTSALFSGAVRANNPSEGATGEGLIAGQSFKIDGTGTSQKAVMYMVSNVLSDTYASGLTAQFANFAGDKGFGFNLNTSGGYELYVKNTTWNKALTISNTNAVTLTGALSGTSASFSGAVTSTLAYSNTSDLSFVASANIPGYNLRSSAGGRLSIVTGYIGADISSILVGTGTNNPTTEALRIVHSTGAATFSSSVTATQVAIGTTSPATFLHVNGATAALPATSGTTQSAGNRVRLSTAAGTGILDMGCAGGTGMWLQSTDLTDLSLKYPLLLNPNGGNVGIGTTAPNGGLTIVAPSSSTALSLWGRSGDNFSAIRFQSNTGASTYATIYSNASDLHFENGGALRMMITSGGNVGIGTTSIGSGDKFKVAQSGVAWAIAIDHSYSTQFYADFRYNGTNTGSITGNGTTTSYNITSDYRLKEDLKPINGLEIVNKIKIYDYKWKASDNRMDGVLAHELAEVLPYAVTGIKDGEQMQSVDYSKIVPVMLQAIKDLKIELDTLKNK